MIPALAWAQVASGLEDRKADAEAAQAEAERLARNEDLADAMAVRDKFSMMRHGYTDRQRRQWEQQREAERLDRVNELEAELARLAPERVPTAARYTSQEAEADALLAQAARNRTDPWMRQEVQRFRQRRGDRPVISRSKTSDERALCIDCAVVGATEDQSTLIHLEPDAPEPRYVPDAPPQQHSARAYSGVGWPEIRR